MDYSEFVKSHPRYEMEDMARDMGMSNPSSYPNKDALAEKMANFLEEKISKDDVRGESFSG